jgi:hypothetical protein
VRARVIRSQFPGSLDTLPKLCTQPGSRDAWAFTSPRAARSGASIVAQEGNQSIGWIFAMRRIIQANIDWFKDLLKTEIDETKRTMEKRLAEEEAKLKQLPNAG